MVYQASEDAKAFAEELSKREKVHASALADLEARLTASHADAASKAASDIDALAGEIASSERRIGALAAALERAGLDAERDAAAAAREAKETSDKLLADQAEALKRAAAECLIAERVDRHGQLDEVRARLNGLKQALDVNSAALEASHASNRLALATFGLDDAASRGAPFAREARLVRVATAPKGDALVDAVLGCAALANAERATSGVPTTSALTDRLEDVARAARALALVPAEAKGGVLTYIASHAAAMIRVAEGKRTRGGGFVPEGAGRGDDAEAARGVESAAAAAAEKAALGDLAGAADALERGTRGTAAERACAGWIDDARERTRVDMALVALKAHASVVNSALA